MAVASGEDLASSVAIITKVLTAFNLDIRGNADVLDKLHAVAANTPLSFESLGDALKNSAGAKIRGSHNSNVIDKKHLTYKYRVSTLKVG
jgi:hypothetical protein